MKTTFPIAHFKSIADLNRQCAQDLISLAQDAIDQRGGFSLVLSGGNTPKSLYTLLASTEVARQIDWSKVHFFWGDERCIPPYHHDSNFKMANDSLLSHIPRGPVFRMKGEFEPVMGAADYEEVLRTAPLLWLTAGATNKFPAFDLILLGLGNDGHTASLFPNSEVLEEKQRLVCAVPAPDSNPSVPRLTLTLPVINSARHIWFIAAGPKKKTIIDHMAGGFPPTYPAARIKLKDGVRWFVAE